MRKVLPYLLFLIGFLLIAGAGFVWWQSSQPQPAANAGAGAVATSTGASTIVSTVASTSAGVPVTIASFPLAQSQSGDAAIASIQQLPGAGAALVSGVVAQYGQGSVTLYVAETASDAQALDLVNKMDAAIGAGGTAYTPVGVFQFRNRNVYMMNSSGRSNFFIQSGAKVIWLTIVPEQAEQAMKEMLDFYP